MIENIMFSHAPRSIELVNETPKAVKRCQDFRIAWDDKIWQAGILSGLVQVNLLGKRSSNHIVEMTENMMFSHAPRIFTDSLSLRNKPRPHPVFCMNWFDSLIFDIINWIWRRGTFMVAEIHLQVYWKYENSVRLNNTVDSNWKINLCGGSEFISLWSLFSEFRTSPGLGEKLKKNHCFVLTGLCWKSPSRHRFRLYDGADANFER
jgi:hypothetical protein